MSPVKSLGWLFLTLLVLPACDDKKTNYSGFSNLVSERNAARQAISQEKDREKNLESDILEAPDKDKKKEGSSSVLYEREVKVVDSSSQKTLAQGVAYMNKQGQIVKIKIIRE